MERMINENKDLIKRLKRLKNELLDVHINSNDSMSAMTGIAKLTEVSNELKELLILLHTNGVTEIKYTKESLMKSQNEVLDVVTSIVEAQNVVLEDLSNTKKPILKTGHLGKLADTIFSSPRLIGVFIFIIAMSGLMVAHTYLPEQTDAVLGSFKNIMKLLIG